MIYDVNNSSKEPGWWGVEMAFSNRRDN